MNITNEKVKDLLNSFNFSREGNLLKYTQDETSIPQTDFLKKHLTEIKPKILLETGTNIGCFSVFLKEVLGDVKLITFGIDSWSRDCIDKIQEFYETDFIDFHLGDSTKTLSNFSTDDTIDAAWVDGGHTYNAAKSDLVNCSRLKIEHIFVDDFNGIDSVKKAVEDFCNQEKYRLTDSSKDNRGIAYLTRNE